MDMGQDFLDQRQFRTNPNPKSNRIQLYASNFACSDSPKSNIVHFWSILIFKLFANDKYRSQNPEKQYIKRNL